MGMLNACISNSMRSPAYGILISRTIFAPAVMVVSALTVLNSGPADWVIRPRSVAVEPRTGREAHGSRK